jgi:hypothetical protein
MRVLKKINPSEMFNDPISKKMMINPVVASDGYTYEQDSILGYIQTNSRKRCTNMDKDGNMTYEEARPPISVMTRAIMPNNGFTTQDGFILNNSLRSSINQWIEKQSLAQFTPTKLNQDMPDFTSGYNGIMLPKGQRLEKRLMPDGSNGLGGKKRATRTTRKRNFRGRRRTNNRRHRRNVKK